MKNTLRAALLVTMILPTSAQALPPIAPAAAETILGIFTPQTFVLFIIAAAIVATTIKAKNAAAQ